MPTVEVRERKGRAAKPAVVDPLLFIFDGPQELRRNIADSEQKREGRAPTRQRERPVTANDDLPAGVKPQRPPEVGKAVPRALQGRDELLEATFEWIYRTGVEIIWQRAAQTLAEGQEEWKHRMARARGKREAEEATMRRLFTEHVKDLKRVSKHRFKHPLPNLMERLPKEVLPAAQRLIEAHRKRVRAINRYTEARFGVARAAIRSLLASRNRLIQGFSAKLLATAAALKPWAEHVRSSFAVPATLLLQRVQHLEASTTSESRAKVLRRVARSLAPLAKLSYAPPDLGGAVKPAVREAAGRAQNLARELTGDLQKRAEQEMGIRDMETAAERLVALRSASLFAVFSEDAAAASDVYVPRCAEALMQALETENVNLARTLLQLRKSRDKAVEEAVQQQDAAEAWLSDSAISDELQEFTRKSTAEHRTRELAAHLRQLRALLGVR